MKIVTIVSIGLLAVLLHCSLATGTLQLSPSTSPASSSTSYTVPSTQSTLQTNTTASSSSSDSSTSTGAEVSAVNFIRMKDVQKDGQSVGDTLARLSLLKKVPQSSSTAVSSDSKAVEDMFDSFNTQVSGSIPEFDELINQMVTTSSGSTCRYQSMNFSHATNSFLNTDAAFGTIYPGSIIQSKYIDDVQNGIQSQVPVPISTSMKNTNIKVLDHTSGEIKTVPYNNAQMTPSINKIIASSLTSVSSLPVYFQMGTSDDMAFFANKMGFNTNIQKKLGIYYTKSSTFTTYKKKIIFSFFKLISTFEVSIESATNPINTFFSSLLTVDEVVKRNNSWWGVGYPPIYIDSVTYGSALILTVDYTNVTGPLYESINSNTAMGSTQIQIILNKIIVNPTLKVLSLGPFSAAELSAIKTGKWADYLLKVPNTFTSQMTNPLIYTVKNFKQQKYNSTVNLEYYKIDCQAAIPEPVNISFFDVSVNRTDVSLNSTQNSAPIGVDFSRSASFFASRSDNATVNNNVFSPSLGKQLGSSPLSYAISYSDSYGTQASIQPRLLLLLSNILSYAPVHLYIYETNGTLIDKKIINVNAAALGLDSYFTGSEITVDIRPIAGKKSLTSALQGQVSITFILNGQEVPKGTFTCKDELCADKATAVFKVNKEIPSVLP